jgi:hypothetical protein
MASTMYMIQSRGRLATADNQRRARASCLLIIVLAAGSVAATDAASTHRDVRIAPVGTWNQVVSTPRGDEQTMVSLHPDGTVSGIAPRGNVPCASGTGPCSLEMPSLGRWAPTAQPSTFTYTLTEYVYDSNGNLNGFLIPDETITLSSDGQSYTGTVTTGFWTTSGTLVFTVRATSSGSRLKFPPY